MLRRAEYWAWRLGGRLSLPLPVLLPPKGDGEDRRLDMWLALPVPNVWAKSRLCVFCWDGCVSGSWGSRMAVVVWRTID